MLARYLNHHDLAQPQWRWFLFHIHRVMASTHGIRAALNIPGKPCTGKGVTMEGWKHWAYPFILSVLHERGLLQMREKFSITAVGAPTVLLLNDQHGPLDRCLASWGFRVFSCDSEPVPSVGLLRPTPRLIRIRAESNSPLTFGDESFPIVCVLGRGPDHPIIEEAARLCAHGGLLVYVMPVKWNWHLSIDAWAGELGRLAPAVSAPAPAEHKYQGWQLAAFPDLNHNWIGVTL